MSKGWGRGRGFDTSCTLVAALGGESGIKAGGNGCKCSIQEDHAFDLVMGHIRVQSVGPLVVSCVLGYGMVAWALLCFRPAGLDGGADYSACDSASESYGTFNGVARPPRARCRCFADG